MSDKTIMETMKDVIVNYDTIKEQRDKLLMLLTCYVNFLQGDTSLYRDSQKLISEINEQIQAESRIDKCEVCGEYKHKNWKICNNIYCESLLIKKDKK